MAGAGEMAGAMWEGDAMLVSKYDAKDEISLQAPLGVWLGVLII